jgi:hypothetical protein
MAAIDLGVGYGVFHGRVRRPGDFYCRRRYALRAEAHREERQPVSAPHVATDEGQAFRETRHAEGSRAAVVHDGTGVGRKRSGRRAGILEHFARFQIPEGIKLLVIGLHRGHVVRVRTLREVIQRVPLRAVFVRGELDLIRIRRIREEVAVEKRALERFELRVGCRVEPLDTFAAGGSDSAPASAALGFAAAVDRDDDLRLDDEARAGGDLDGLADIRGVENAAARPSQESVVGPVNGQIELLDRIVDWLRARVRCRAIRGHRWR